MELSRYVTVANLEDRRRKLEEIPSIEVITEVTTLYDEFEVEVQVQEGEEKVFVEEAQELGLFPDLTLIDGARVLKQFDGADKVSEKFMLEVLSSSYPAKVTWTENRDRCNTMVTRYAKRVRSNLYQVPSYDRIRIEQALDKIIRAKGSAKQFFEVYYVNDNIIKSCFREYVERKLKIMVARMLCIRKKRPRWTALHREREGGVVRLSSTTREFKIEISLWHRWASQLLEGVDVGMSIYRMLMSYMTFIKHATSFFSSVPRLLYQYIGSKYGIEGELFASPLNYICSKYYSFGPYDREFGSMGSFFESETLQGRWFANPPFLLEFIQRLADYLHFKVKEKSAPFTMLLFVSEAYSSVAKEVYKFLRSHIYFKGSKIIEARESCYDQYCKDQLRLGVVHRYFTRCNSEIMLFTNEMDITEVIIDDTIAYWKLVSSFCNRGT